MKWIRIEDSPPPEGPFILISNEKKLDEGYFYSGIWISRIHFFPTFKPTHWGTIPIDKESTFCTQSDDLGTLLTDP